MGSHDSFGHLKKVMLQKKGGSEIENLIPNHEKSGIDPTSLRVGRMPHIIEKLWMRAITLAKISFQSKVYTQSYGAPKSRESQLWEFWDFHLGVLGKDVI
jgi:hypothetical protein